jgi:hypothetical protein
VNFILVLTDEETAVQRETCRQEKENMIWQWDLINCLSRETDFDEADLLL